MSCAMRPAPPARESRRCGWAPFWEVDLSEMTVFAATGLSDSSTVAGESACVEPSSDWQLPDVPAPFVELAEDAWGLCSALVQGVALTVPALVQSVSRPARPACRSRTSDEDLDDGVGRLLDSDGKVVAAPSLFRYCAIGTPKRLYRPRCAVTTEELLHSLRSSPSEACHWSSAQDCAIDAKSEEASFSLGSFRDSLLALSFVSQPSAIGLSVVTQGSMAVPDLTYLLGTGILALVVARMFADPRPRTCGYGYSSHWKNCSAASLAVTTLSIQCLQCVSSHSQIYAIHGVTDLLVLPGLLLNYSYILEPTGTYAWTTQHALLLCGSSVNLYAGQFGLSGLCLAAGAFSMSQQADRSLQLGSIGLAKAAAGVLTVGQLLLLVWHADIFCQHPTLAQDRRTAMLIEIVSKACFVKLVTTEAALDTADYAFRPTSRITDEERDANRHQ